MANIIITLLLVFFFLSFFPGVLDFLVPLILFCLLVSVIVGLVLYSQYEKKIAMETPEQREARLQREKVRKLKREKERELEIKRREKERGLEIKRREKREKEKALKRALEREVRAREEARRASEERRASEGKSLQRFADKDDHNRTWGLGLYAEDDDDRY